MMISPVQPAGNAQMDPAPAESAARPARKHSFLRPIVMVTLSFLLFCGVPLSLMLVFSALASEGATLEVYHSLERYGGQKVAIITIEGPILDGDGFVKDQIDRVREDDDVKAVVVRVNSPGGTVAGSDFMYHHLDKLRKERSLPLVVSMGDMAASGGYYVAMSVGETPDTIFAEPTTWTGSIGVIIPHFNVAGLMEKWDVEADSVASHRLKGMGSITKRMTDEERAIFQELVDEMFGRFKEVIKAGRPKFQADEAALEAIATGQVFTTRQAIANGLVDKEGFIEEAIDRAIVLAGLDKSDVQAVEYERPLALSDLLIGSARAKPPGLGELLELATPKAYYLWTLLPALEMR